MDDYQQRVRADFERIKAVRAHAEAHVWDPETNPDFVPAKDSRHVVDVRGPETTLRLIFTVTKWRGRLLRQLSLTATEPGVDPHPLIVQTWCEAFGYEGSMDQWQVSPSGHSGVTIIQPFRA